MITNSAEISKQLSALEEFSDLAAERSAHCLLHSFNFFQSKAPY